MTGGTFAPYAEFDTDRWPAFYMDQAQYVSQVRNAAQHGVVSGWRLAEDLGSVVTVAEQKRQELGVVLQPGDVLEIQVRNASGLIGKRVYQVSEQDIARAYVTLDLDAASLRPAVSQVHQNYPNPFNSDTWIPYELSKPSNVTVRIYDATGHVV